MTTTRFQDQFNDKKVWVIRKYSSGNFYMNQEISGRLFNKKFTRVTKSKIKELGFEI